MSQDELAVMDGGKCILQLRGVRPFLSDKFDITKHPNYKYLSDYDKKNAFDIERFLSARLKLRPDEQFAAYSIDLSGDEAAEETGGWLPSRKMCAFRNQSKINQILWRYIMEFFNSAVDVLQTLVIALGAGLGIWGVINLLEGYGNDNPGANAHVP